MGNRFPVAPWPTMLKVTSAVATVVLAAAGFIAYRTIPVPTGFTHLFGLGIALVFPAIAAFAFLFMVTGYETVGGDLHVERPLWSTRIALAGLTSARHEPGICKGSLRIFGNGGMYSFTGLYQNRALGRFRLFGTDVRRAVVLRVGHRVVVVTPADPATFVAYLGQLFPGARDEAAHGLGSSAPRVGRGRC
jgi:Bacterial PH domain